MFFVVYYFLNRPSCGEDSEAVAYARSLSSERLERLYHDMELFSRNKKVPMTGYQTYNEEAYVPDEFADLDVALVRPRDGNIMVEGCFDHYIYLKFEGVGRLSRQADKKRIILNWGEHPPHAGSEILWSGE